MALHRDRPHSPVLSGLSQLSHHEPPQMGKGRRPPRHTERVPWEPQGPQSPLPGPAGRLLPSKATRHTTWLGHVSQLATQCPGSRNVR